MPYRRRYFGAKLFGSAAAFWLKSQILERDEYLLIAIRQWRHFPWHQPSERADAPTERPSSRADAPTERPSSRADAPTRNSSPVLKRAENKATDLTLAL